jgi:ribonuclease HII
MTLFEYDEAVRREYGVFCGVDEAGRGPLAGDVYAAAVVFGAGTRIDGLDDSKKLSAKKRDLLFNEITAKASAYCVAFATVSEIETLNILNAALLAMKRAVCGLGISVDLVLTDGTKKPPLDRECRAVVKGDGLSASIAAASVLAKVSRDRYMERMAAAYPAYHFEKHKGYGTKLHFEMIKAYGVCEIHRLSFLKKAGLTAGEL